VNIKIRALDSGSKERLSISIDLTPPFTYLAVLVGSISLLLRRVRRGVLVRGTVVGVRVILGGNAGVVDISLILRAPVKSTSNPHRENMRGNTFFFNTCVGQCLQSRAKGFFFSSTAGVAGNRSRKVCICEKTQRDSGREAARRKSTG